MERGEEEDYRFLPLRDEIVCLGQKVNLLGVITDFWLPKKSKGPDYVCTLKIVDESYQPPPISVNIFVRKPEELPSVKSAGDLIQVSHVVMKLYKGNAVARFNKKFSSFAMFDGKSSDHLHPYQASLKFQSSDSGKDFIKQLRTWLLNFQLNAGTSEQLLSLKEIKEG